MTMTAQTQRSLALGGEFLKRLESLAVQARREVAAGNVAARAGGVRGGRVEFLEHRGYVAGDDLRDLDWHVYARTGEPFVKVFGAEREKYVNILLDLSPSTTFSAEKAVFACRLAAALAHVALASGDTVRLFCAGSDLATPPRKGVRNSRELIAFLERLPTTGALDWSEESARYRNSPKPPGALLIVSDFWADEVLAALAPLLDWRQDIALLQVLTPAEIDPPLSGNVRLTDAETGEEVSLGLTAADLEAYRRGVEKTLAALADGARRRGMRHLLCRTDTPFESLVLTYLRRGGLLR